MAELELPVTLAKIPNTRLAQIAVAIRIDFVDFKIVFFISPISFEIIFDRIIMQKNR